MLLSLCAELWECQPAAIIDGGKIRGAAEKRRNVRLVTHIKSIHEESKKTYGSPRIHVELRSRGIQCGKNRVAMLMRKQRNSGQTQTEVQGDNGFQSYHASA